MNILLKCRVILRNRIYFPSKKLILMVWSLCKTAGPINMHIVWNLQIYRRKSDNVLNGEGTWRRIRSRHSTHNWHCLLRIPIIEDLSMTSIIEDIGSSKQIRKEWVKWKHNKVVTFYWCSLSYLCCMLVCSEYLLKPDIKVR